MPCGVVIVPARAYHSDASIANENWFLYIVLAIIEKYYFLQSLNTTFECEKRKLSFSWIENTRKILWYSISHATPSAYKLSLESSKSHTRREDIFSRESSSISPIYTPLSSWADVYELCKKCLDKYIWIRCYPWDICMLRDDSSSYLVECAISHMEHPPDYRRLSTLSK